MSGTPELVEDLSGLPARMQKDLLANYEKLLGILEAALNAKKMIRRPEGQECPKCGCKHTWSAEVDDVKTARETAEWFSNRAFGRPSAAESEQDAEKVTLVRKVIFSGVEDVDIRGNDAFGV